MATAPEQLPSPRGAHLEMVGAVLAGEGLDRIATIASAHAEAPVAVIVPRLSTASATGRASSLERYVAARLGKAPDLERPPEVVAEVPIATGGQQLGAVLMLGEGGADAGEYLHMAAVAALTEVAVADARDEAEQTLRGSLLEELLQRDDLDPHDVLRRARRMGCDVSEGVAAVCADPGDRSPGRLLAVIADERPDAIAQAVGERVYAVLPGSAQEARALAARLGRHGLVGISSSYRGPGELRRALEEAELVLDVTADGRAPEEQVGGGTYRLLFRVLASHPEEVRSFYEDTVARVVSYDEQYSTDLVGTLEAYLAENCNMNATASAIHAHRHTVSYRLDRIRELTGLDPTSSEDRERLGLGLKAYRIIAPRLPR
ncbi:MAG TPA: helix-turn-helix domain-containing protein [Thermoleophilaceae bacterium]